MGLTREDVLRVAELARLDLTEQEVDLFTRQIADILGYAEQLQDVDTTGVSPMSHVNATDGAWRDDTPGGSLALEESFANAPSADRTAGLYKVPKVL